MFTIRIASITDKRKLFSVQFTFYAPYTTLSRRVWRSGLPFAFRSWVCKFKPCRSTFSVSHCAFFNFQLASEVNLHTFVRSNSENQYPYRSLLQEERELSKFRPSFPVSVLFSADRRQFGRPGTHWYPRRTIHYEEETMFSHINKLNENSQDGPREPAMCNSSHSVLIFRNPSRAYLDHGQDKLHWTPTS